MHSAVKYILFSHGRSLKHNWFVLKRRVFFRFWVVFGPYFARMTAIELCIIKVPSGVDCSLNFYLYVRIKYILYIYMSTFKFNTIHYSNPLLIYSTAERHQLIHFFFVYLLAFNKKLLKLNNIHRYY